MTSKPDASMEGLKLKFKKHIADAPIESFKVPYDFERYLMAFMDEHIPALLKEAEERIIRHLEEDRWTHHKLDHSFRSEFSIQEDLESEINRLCLQSHNGMVDQAIKITKASLTEPKG